MDIKNLERAVEAKHELFKLEEAIKNLNMMSNEKGKVGFLISEHKDHSGASVDYQYVNGNYHPLYADILEYTKKRFNVARDQLIAEIKSL